MFGGLFLLGPHNRLHCASVYASRGAAHEIKVVMAVRVVIAEKRSLAEDIANALSDSVQRASGHFIAGSVRVTYCSGHLLENLKPDEIDPRMSAWTLENIPYIPTSWPMRPRSLKDEAKRDVKKNGKIVLDERVVKQIETIKVLLSQASEVIHAGDADREGQLIVDEVLEYLGNRKPVQRVWLQELNPQGIRKAFQRMKPNADYALLSNSATARSRADYLVGMNATRGYTTLWQGAGNDGMVNVGRVQTPTLWLVWQRENERANFRPTDHYGVRADLSHANGGFACIWVPTEGAAFLDAEGRVLSRDAAESVAKLVLGQQGEIQSVQTERKKDSQPLPYTLLELQKGAAKLLGLRPAQTLDIVQSLYEIHKVVSYPRTDSPYLPEEDHGSAAEVLKAVRGNFAPEWPFRGDVDLQIRSPAWNNKKLGAHFGIIPTVGRKPIGQLTAMEKAVYGMVVRRYLAQFMPAHEYDATVVLISCQGESFKANGRIVRILGWKELYQAGNQKTSQAAPSAKDDAALPQLAANEIVTFVEVSIQEKRTVAPPLLDSASLLDAMKDVHKYVEDPKVKKLLKNVEGLGTEATRANIISYLVSRGYIAEVPKEKGKDVEYVTTEKGRALLAIIQEQLARPDLTAWFEGQLEGIRDGATTLERFELSVAKFVVQMVERLKAPEARQAVPQVHDPAARPCPKCGGRLKLREAKATKEKFWGCRAYPGCKHTEEFVEERDAPKRRAASRGGSTRKAPGLRRARPKAGSGRATR